MRTTKTERRTNSLERIQAASERLNAGRKMLQQAASALVTNSSSEKMSELKVMVVMCEKLEEDFKKEVADQ
jgi:hypothetical protein